MQTTIVLADDHPVVRAGVRRLLEEREDISVVGEASNGREAVDMVMDKRPDMAVMDIQMPKLSGVDATRCITNSESETRVLVLSVHDSGTWVEEVLRAGASGYIVKTAASRELLDAIDAVRSGRSYLSPLVTGQVVGALTSRGESGEARIGSLTSREREVLQLIAEGLSSREIASVLGVSLKTVDSHRSNLMDKLDIHKVPGLVRIAVREGLIQP